MEFQLNLDSETVEQAHPSDPLVVAPRATVREVLELMKAQSQGAVLICHPGGELLGIFTERDAVRILATGLDLNDPIERVMVRNPIALQKSDTVGKAIAMMAAGGYRRMPILDRSGRPVGMLRVSGILEYLVEHFPKTVYTLPPRPHHLTQEREGA